MSKLTDKITEIAEPIAAKHGLSLWDVEYLKEGGERYLRVSIDRAEGVSIEDCEAVSRELEPLIDELDPIEESYIFEVSSAGADRRLKRPRDFERCMGRSVEVKLYRAIDGKKEFTGTLAGYAENGDITVNVGDTPMIFAKGDAAKVQLAL